MIFLALTYSTSSTSASKRTSCGVFIHGQSIESKDWEDVVMGNQADAKLGRLLKAAQVVDLILNSYITDGNLFIQSIMFGSGIQSTPMMKEGQYSREFLLQNFDTLRSFPQFHASSMNEARFYRLKNILQQLSCTDDLSINTATEITSCMEHFQSKKVDVIFLVSSSTHASRCIREACSYLDRLDKREYDPIVCMVPADTSFSGFDASDVIIFEPPHLPQDVHEYAGGMSSYALAQRWQEIVNTNNIKRQREIHAEFDALLKRYEVL